MIAIYAEETERTLVLYLEDGPAIQTSHGQYPATELKIIYRRDLKRVPVTDLVLSCCGTVCGHYPSKSYPASYEEYEPRPDWTHALIAEHAPAWWSATETAHDH